MRQYLVVDLDEFKCLARGFRIARRHSGDGVPVIQRLAACHAILKHIVKLGIAVGEIRQVRARDDGLDAGELFGTACIDASDLRVRVW